MDQLLIFVEMMITGTFLHHNEAMFSIIKDVISDSDLTSFQPGRLTSHTMAVKFSCGAENCVNENCFSPTTSPS